MAGIIATSATKSNSAETSPDAVVIGYLTGEQITLTASPSGASYVWSLSAAPGSSSSALTDELSQSPRFTPDVAGYYVATCTVDGAGYIIRIAAANIGQVGTIGALRMVPISDAQIPTPESGVTMYYSSDQSSLSIKTISGNVKTVDSTGA